MLSEEDLVGIIDELAKILEEKQDIIQSVDWIPSFSLQPPFVLYEERERVLGISSAVLKPVYKAVYQECMRYVSSVKSVDHQGSYRLATSRWEINSLSKITLLIKGDLSFIYNLRKKLLIEDPNLIPYEIPFTSLVFSKHPKSPSGWEHRRFCYKLKHRMENKLKLLPMELVTEQELCRRSADAYPKNYYAWMHRLWLLQFFSYSQLEEELELIKIWIFQHPSDHSAVNHHVQVVHRMFQQHSSEVLNFVSENQSHLIEQQSPPSNSQIFILYITNILNEIEETFRRYVIRETLWQWRRLLFHLLFEKIGADMTAISSDEETLLLSYLSWCHLLLKGEISIFAPGSTIKPGNTLGIFLCNEIFLLGNIYQTNNEDRESIIKYENRYLSYIFHLVLRRTPCHCIALRTWYTEHLLPHFLTPISGDK